MDTDDDKEQRKTSQASVEAALKGALKTSPEPLKDKPKAKKAKKKRSDERTSPALPAEPCDCGCLELALNVTHNPIPAFVAGARGERFDLRDKSTGSFVRSQQFPADRLITDAAASDLPDAHDGVVLFGGPHRVNLDIARISVVVKLKNESSLKRGACDLTPHLSPRWYKSNGTT
jgi:hypothetical protein